MLFIQLPQGLDNSHFQNVSNGSNVVFLLGNDISQVRLLLSISLILYNCNEDVYNYRSFVTLKAEANTSDLDVKSSSVGKFKNIDMPLEEQDQRGSTDNDWMAEPLTDAATREANKDTMRVRMEMFIM